MLFIGGFLRQAGAALGAVWIGWCCPVLAAGPGDRTDARVVALRSASPAPIDLADFVSNRGMYAGERVRVSGCYLVQASDLNVICQLHSGGHSVDGIVISSKAFSRMDLRRAIRTCPGLSAENPRSCIVTVEGVLLRRDLLEMTDVRVRWPD